MKIIRLFNITKILNCFSFIFIFKNKDRESPDYFYSFFQLICILLSTTVKSYLSGINQWQIQDFP